MRRLLLFALLLLLCVTPAVPVFAQSAPEFEPEDCWFDVPDDFDVECGLVTVPESRDPAMADDSNEIRLAVVLVHSFSADPDPDPVIYFDGGPGGHTLVFADFYMQDFAPFLETRDLILFDQRGVGFSEPNLSCPAVTELSYELLDADLSYEESLETFNGAYFDCRETLLADGVNINAYNSAENAADVRDITAALGYEQVNLFGISYGTKLGLTVMRDHPEIVRSAVLDAVYPPNVNSEEEYLPNMVRAFNELFDGCAQDAACAATYPDLEAVFYDTVDRLNASPEVVTFYDQYTGEDRDVLVDGNFLIGGLFSLLYSTGDIPALPEYIYQASAGIYDGFLDDAMFTLAFNQFFSDGMFYAVECYEEVLFNEGGAVLDSLEGLPPEIETYYTADNDAYADDYIEFCKVWTDGLTADPRENEAVVSDIPTLLTVGEYDPITPPAWARLAAETLSSSYVYEFPGVGHSAFYGGDCPAEMIFSFIEDPATEPDASCIDDMPPPQFAQAPITEVTLVEYSSEELGFSGVVPEGWEEIEAGIFTPNPSTQIPTLAYRFPDSIDEYVERIIFGPSYSYTELPEPVDQIEANGLTWDIYAIENPGAGIYTLFAFATGDDDRAYVIGVVSGSEEEREFFYDALLIPAIEAFTPEA